jgi:acetyltransferase-like isoleucine patch superfamily enzyme
VLSVLEKVRSCDPPPAEILVHVDAANSTLECKLRRQFPDVKILTSSTRLGPGGGRHRCLVACNTPYAVSFDDDSYPVDRDFFSHVEPLFLRHPRAAIFGASIWHRCEAERARIQEVVPVATYTGCGYAVRLAAYRQVRGTLSLPVAYGMEETDLSIQLFAAGWQIYEAGLLRVLHDTDSKHHESFEITAGAISNVGLFVFLHFPVVRWGSGFLRVANRIAYSLRKGRFRGVLSGITQIPIICYQNRRFRRPIDWFTLNRYLSLRRTRADEVRATAAIKHHRTYSAMSKVEPLLLRIPRGAMSRVRLLVYRALGMRLGKRNRMEGGGRVRRCSQIAVGDFNSFTQGCWLWPEDTDYDGIRIRIGNSNYFNRNLMIDACGSVEIGDFNMIGPDVYITDSNHQIANGLGPGELPMDKGTVVIGNRCWIGAKAVILRDVDLGDGCVVAAGAVVTRSVAPGQVVAGVPARPIQREHSIQLSAASGNVGDHHNTSDLVRDADLAGSCRRWLGRAVRPGK